MNQIIILITGNNFTKEDNERKEENRIIHEGIPVYVRCRPQFF